MRARLAPSQLAAAEIVDGPAMSLLLLLLLLGTSVSFKLFILFFPSSYFLVLWLIFWSHPSIYLSIIHPSSIHHPSIIHPSSIHHPSIIYPSSIHHLSIIYPSSIHHLSIIHPSSIHHPSIIYASIRGRKSLYLAAWLSQPRQLEVSTNPRSSAAPISTSTTNCIFRFFWQQQLGPILVS
jgi:hypothetical protein